MSKIRPEVTFTGTLLSPDTVSWQLPDLIMQIILSEPLDGREEERRTGETSQGLWRQNQSYDKSGKQKRIYPYDKAASLAEEFREDLENLKTLLEQQGVQLPKSRFYENNAELMRFAFTTGLTTAESPAERLVSFQINLPSSPLR